MRKGLAGASCKRQQHRPSSIAQAASPKQHPKTFWLTQTFLAEVFGAKVLAQKFNDGAAANAAAAAAARPPAAFEPTRAAVGSGASQGEDGG